MGVSEVNHTRGGYVNRRRHSTEIKIGHTTAQSGTLADYGNIARVLEVIAADINKSGGIKDSEGKTRKVTFLVKDDGYDSARTIPLWTS